jgi:hypothetical protein
MPTYPWWFSINLPKFSCFAQKKWLVFVKNNERKETGDLRQEFFGN